MTKKLNELNRDELRQVFDKNKTLREIVFDHAAENADFWIEEYMDCFEDGAVSYSLDISGYNNYFSVTDVAKFLNGLEKAQKMYCFLADEYNVVIEKAAVLNERYKNSDDLSDLNFERVENRLKALVKTLESACYKRIRSEYDIYYDDNELFDCFISGWLDEMNTDNFYVDENYKLFEHVEYEKEYA